MKYTFYVISSDGYPFFPMELGDMTNPVTKWTLNINNAVLWAKPEDFDCIRAEYDNVVVVGVDKDSEYLKNLELLVNNVFK